MTVNFQLLLAKLWPVNMAACYCLMAFPVTVLMAFCLEKIPKPVQVSVNASTWESSHCKINMLIFYKNNLYHLTCDFHVTMVLEYYRTKEKRVKC